MIFRGAIIYEVKSLPGAHGHEQQGRRYAVIVQSDRFATITIAMTSTQAGPAGYRPEIDLSGAKTRVLTDQIFAVTHNMLGELAGALEPGELTDLDRALMLKLGLI